NAIMALIGVFGGARAMGDIISTPVRGRTPLPSEQKALPTGETASKAAATGETASKAAATGETASKAAATGESSKTAGTTQDTGATNQTTIADARAQEPIGQPEAASLLLEAMERNAGGLRRPALETIEPVEMERLKQEFADLGGDPEMLQFNQGRRT